MAAPDKRRGRFPEDTTREAKQDWAARDRPRGRDKDIMLMFILGIALLVALVACLPIWPHSRKWNFYPISGVSMLILLILFLLVIGRR